MTKMQTYRVIIDRHDNNKYLGCVLVNSERAIVDFQVPEGTTPTIRLEKMEEVI